MYKFPTRLSALKTFTIYILCYWIVNSLAHLIPFSIMLTENDWIKILELIKSEFFRLLITTVVASFVILIPIIPAFVLLLILLYKQSHFKKIAYWTLFTSFLGSFIVWGTLFSLNFSHVHNKGELGEYTLSCLLMMILPSITCYIITFGFLNNHLKHSYT